jgi:hypothetical protein
VPLLAWPVPPRSGRQITKRPVDQRAGMPACSSRSQAPGWKRTVCEALCLAPPNYHLHPLARSSDSRARSDRIRAVPKRFVQLAPPILRARASRPPRSWRSAIISSPSLSRIAGLPPLCHTRCPHHPRTDPCSHKSVDALPPVNSSSTQRPPNPSATPLPRLTTASLPIPTPSQPTPHGPPSALADAYATRWLIGKTCYLRSDGP